MISAVGRANIENSKNIQITNIEKNKIEQLKSLDIKFANVDAAKKSLGYIAVISLSILFGSIFLNDFIKLANFVLNYYVRQTNLAENTIEERGEDSKLESSSYNTINIQIDTTYSNILERRLELAHVSLLKAMQKRHANLTESES